MTDSKFQPKTEIMITDLDALKIIADPTRNQIMEILTPKPLTVNQVAKKLGSDASKLYYHFNLLEKNGFITVVDTTIRGNLVEKHYWITAYSFDLDQSILNFNVDTPEGTETIITLVLANIEATREDLRRSIYARHQQIQEGAPKNPRTVMDHRSMLNLPDDKALEFRRRLQALIDEFQEEEETLNQEETDQKTIPWGLSIVFYPSFYFNNGEGDSHE